MQKALIYEAIFIVNRGIDDAVSALERLKNNREAQDAGLSPAFLGPLSTATSPITSIPRKRPTPASFIRITNSIGGKIWTKSRSIKT